MIGFPLQWWLLVVQAALEFLDTAYFAGKSCAYLLHGEP